MTTSSGARPNLLPWGGRFKGHDGVREFLAKVTEAPAKFGREVRDYLGADDRIAVLLRLFGRATASGTEFSVTEIHVWTVREGRIVDLEASFDTATVLGALQLEAST
jgi:uncharacterized protein